MSALFFSRFSVLLTVLFGIGMLVVLPLHVHAHEVYVLSHDTIQTALATPPPSPLTIINDNLAEFTFWAFLSSLVVFIVFFASISRGLENLLDPFFLRIKHYAPAVARVTIGISLLAGAYFQALFGPELTLQSLFGDYVMLATGILVVSGILMIIGKWTRYAAVGALSLFVVAVAQKGSYMLTYTSYLGEILVLLLVGGHRFSADPLRLVKHGPRHWLEAIAHALAPYSFAILRACFGISLLYASLYAKFFHAELALRVVTEYNLTHFFPFDPLFVVLGAGLIEITIGLFFLLGIEIRFTAVFLAFWLTLSLLYFGEAVWPHVVLFGIPLAFFLYGYDKYSVEGYFFKTERGEPVF